MGIFNMFTGSRDAVAGVGVQAADVIQTLKSASRDREQALQRMAAALDAASLPLLLADELHTIVHANAAALRALRASEADLRTSLPALNIANPVGCRLDALYPPSTLQQGLFDNLVTSRSDTVCIGSRCAVLTASALHDAQRCRIGSLVEWLDVTDSQRQTDTLTAQLATALQAGRDATAAAAAENERRLQDISSLTLAAQRLQQQLADSIDAALAGDFSKRIDVAVFQGREAMLAARVNHMVSHVEQTIGEVAAAMAALAEGRLTCRITQEYEGSFGRLKTAVNTTIDKLVEVVGGIQQSAEGVKAGAVDINNSNSNLSRRTEQQAASLEQTSAAMEQITTTVQQNAANAIQANNLARGARETAENGGQVVSRAVAAMQAISESSNKINDIIGVIDEIAFQTNLLALNAAVEAARAGDQGRGFAVVADEVRNLAGRSARAAKEIKELIKDSSEKVKEGSLLVNKSGATLDEIVTAVKKVNDIVAEISTASDEQASGLDEVSRAVSEMDTMTQQNAALVEQAAIAGRTLDGQAAALEALMTFFDTGLAKRVAPAAPLPTPVAPATAGIAGKPLSKTAMTARTAKPPVAMQSVRSRVRARPIVPPHDDEDRNWTEF